MKRVEFSLAKRHLKRLIRRTGMGTAYVVRGLNMSFEVRNKVR